MVDGEVEKYRLRLSGTMSNILFLARVFKDIHSENIFDRQELLLQFYYWAYIDENKYVQDLLVNNPDFNPEELTSAETIRRSRQLLKERGIITFGAEKQEAVDEKEKAFRQAVVRE